MNRVKNKGNYTAKNFVIYATVWLLLAHLHHRDYV
jgi:hypothetical protein